MCAGAEVHMQLQRRGRWTALVPRGARGSARPSGLRAAERRSSCGQESGGSAAPAQGFLVPEATPRWTGMTLPAEG